MKRIKLMLIMGVLLVFITGLASAHGDFTEVKKLVEGKVSCDNLTDEQIEEIGDYLMELMHPGEAHEQMHNVVGGETSETVRLMHINMAEMMYCDNGDGMSNMMNMMQGGMMGGGMMGMMPMMSMMGSQNVQSGMMQGMMGGQNPQANMMENWGYGFGYWSFINFLYVILLIGLIILVYLWIIKLLKDMKNKSKK